MVGLECPWCDHQVSLPPQALADETLVCAECNTLVELSAGPAAQVTLMDPAGVGLQLAA